MVKGKGSLYAFGEKVEQLNNLMYKCAWQIENPREFAMLLKHLCSYRLFMMHGIVQSYTRIYEDSQGILEVLNALEQSP